MPDSYRRVSHLDSDPQALTLKRLRQLSRILDKVVTIPGTPIHIGLDPLVGFLPIGGDILGVILASYIVIEAARIGVPKGMLSRMVLNVIIDGLVGTVLIMGDLFDFAWTANEYNIKLLEEHLQLTLPRSK
ncbi:DUF4112 domain-containing protein [Anabaenopsis sp. FSS-46]|uniref:DUF4112 domain-containing protein n=1 Tax=Anabaenopsis sp. FSS-46 TaxID=2971766 RepID=UPI002475B02C|nr:DUF4112 domain-containing protein [Anabaenopsis sp. FSS-46]MDH6099963.1 DUF4112 domain-containing protein [Anabaenopsis sp. FSS-46]